MRLTWSDVIVVLGIIAGYVTLIVTGHATNAEPYVTVAAPILSAYGVARYVSRRSDSQDETLNTLDRRLNGELDNRIENAIVNALRKHGLISSE